MTPLLNIRLYRTATVATYREENEMKILHSRHVYIQYVSSDDAHSLMDQPQAIDIGGSKRQVLRLRDNCQFTFTITGLKIEMDILNGK